MDSLSAQMLASSYNLAMQKIMTSRAYAAHGDAYYKASRYHHAIQAFDMALILNNRDYEVFNKRGVAKVGIRDYIGAFNDYTQAIALKPTFYNAYLNRGNLWIYLGDFAKKMGDRKQAIQHYQSALNDYGQAIRINPFSSPAYENRSELYADLGLNAQALQDKAMVIRLEKLKAPTRQGLPFCPPRIALVLANDDYDGTENDLSGGPVHDATAMARLLQSQGFRVITGFNLSGPQTKAKVAEFVNVLRQNPNAVSLTYYSGHGGSINGNNYLIPTEFTGTVGPNFEDNAVSVDYLLKQLKDSNSYFNMIFLDACRTPLTDGPAFKSAKSALKSWETEPGPTTASNTWIEYASRPAMPALQDKNEGLYTKYLLQFMARPDLNLKEVSMYTSYALESDPVANREQQHARTQTDLSRTEPIAKALYLGKPCGSPSATPPQTQSPSFMSYFRTLLSPQA